MADEGDLPVRRGVVIPASELEETASRSSGPGGQHVNKSNTRVTLRWRLRESNALDPIARRRVEERLAAMPGRAAHADTHLLEVVRSGVPQPFDPISIPARAITVDTSDGYRPGIEEIVSLLS
ncbi:MAG: peptide chain release factor-like protein [Candidatus Binatia bacterium]